MGRKYVLLLSAGTLLASSSAAQAQSSSAGVSGQAIAPVGTTPPVSTTPVDTPTPNAPSADGDAASSGDIVVTANKREESINRVPLSITAVTGDQLAKAGISNAADLVKVVPGFNYTLSAYDTPVYTIRGVGFYDTTIGSKSTVAVYTDEHPYPFSVETSGATLDLERVEVLKGPQGILFGENSTGGAINYIAAKPTKTFKAGADLDVGRFNTVDVGGFVSGPLGPALTARLAARTEQGNGWQESYTRSDHLGDRDFTTFRGILQFEPDSKLKADLSVNGFLDKSDTQAAQLIAVTPLVESLIEKHRPAILNYPLSPPNDRAADWTPGIPLHKDNIYVSPALRIDYTFSQAAKLTILSSYSHYNENELIDPDGTSYVIYHYQTNARINSVAEEIRLSGLVAGKINYVVGGNYSHDRVHEQQLIPSSDASTGYQISDSFPGVPPFFLLLEHADSTFESKAVFGNVDWDISRLFTLHGGVRYTATNNNYAGCIGDAGDGTVAQNATAIADALRSQFGLGPIAPVPPGGCFTLSAQFVPSLVTGQLNENNVSWRAGIDFKPVDGTLLYFNASRGYKEGSFPLLAGSSYTQYSPVTQESILAFEAGVKSRLARGVQFNAAGFYYDYSNKQFKSRSIADPNIFGPLEKLVNVPTSRVVGAEVELELAPLTGLRLNASGTYINSRLGHYVGYDTYGTIHDFNGESFPYTPQLQFTGRADYERPIDADHSAFVGAILTYQGPTNAALGDLPLLKIDRYALLDLSAGVQTRDGKWRLSFWGRNVTNKYYWTNATRNTDVTIRFAGRPATYGASLAFRY